MDRLNHTFNWETVSILNQAKSKNAREFLEAWHSDKAAINRHIEVNNIYIPFKSDNRKGKRPEYPLASNQHPDRQRFIPRLIPDEQSNSTLYLNQGTINSVNQPSSKQQPNQGTPKERTTPSPTQAGQTIVYKQRASPTPPFCTEDVA